jgi:hypothetical protein
MLEIGIFHKELIGDDKFIASVTVPLAEFMDGAEGKKDLWVRCIMSLVHVFSKMGGSWETLSIVTLNGMDTPLRRLTPPPLPQFDLEPAGKVHLKIEYRRTSAGVCAFR